VGFSGKAGNNHAHPGCTRTPRRDHTRGFLAHETVKDSSEKRKKVVEHKGSINFGSQALVLPRAQSLTWDTLFAEISRISLVAAHLQLIQQLAWDTLSQLRITDEIAGNFDNFLLCPCDPAGWATFAEYFANSAEIPVADSCGPAVQKILSRGSFLVAYKVEGWK
jgi:hypothetical protein